MRRFIKVVVAYRPVQPPGAWMGEVITAHIAKKLRTQGDAVVAVSSLDTATTPRWPANPSIPPLPGSTTLRSPTNSSSTSGASPSQRSSDPLDGPGFEDVAILVGLDQNHEVDRRYRRCPSHPHAARRSSRSTALGGPRVGGDVRGLRHGTAQGTPALSFWTRSPRPSGNIGHRRHR